MTCDSNASASSDPAPAAKEPPRLLIATVIGGLLLVVALVVTAVVVAGQIESSPVADTSPLAVPSVPAPGASGKWCGELHEALPDTVGDQPQRQVIGDYRSIAVWGDPAIILRCGLDDPAELDCASALTTFTAPGAGSVSWLRLEDSASITYFAVDRPVRIAVSLPPGSGADPLMDISAAVASALPEQPVCDGAVLTPLDNS